MMMDNGIVIWTVFDASKVRFHPRSQHDHIVLFGSYEVEMGKIGLR